MSCTLRLVVIIFTVETVTVRILLCMTVIQEDCWKFFLFSVVKAQLKQKMDKARSVKKDWFEVDPSVGCKAESKSTAVTL